MCRVDLVPTGTVHISDRISQPVNPEGSNGSPEIKAKVLRYSHSACHEDQSYIMLASLFPFKFSIVSFTSSTNVKFSTECKTFPTTERLNTKIDKCTSLQYDFAGVVTLA